MSAPGESVGAGERWEWKVKVRYEVGARVVLSALSNPSPQSQRG